MLNIRREYNYKSKSKNIQKKRPAEFISAGCFRVYKINKIFFIKFEKSIDFFLLMCYNNKRTKYTRRKTP